MEGKTPAPRAHEFAWAHGDFHVDGMDNIAEGRDKTARRARGPQPENVLLVATAQVHGHCRLTKRDAVSGAWTWVPPERPSTDVVLHPLKADILAPIARARSLLNGGMASSLGLHPAARRHRHRRIIAPQTAGVDVDRSFRIGMWTSQLVKGFGRRPLAGRSCVVRGRRSKASQGGNRGQEGAPVWSGATYGDFRIADGSRVSPRGPVARNLGGGNDDDERVWSRGCAALARARRSGED